MSTSRNPFGFLSGRPAEWGRKARKREGAQRGFRRSAQVEVVSEQLEEYLQEQDELAIVAARFEDAYTRDVAERQDQIDYDDFLAEQDEIQYLHDEWLEETYDDSVYEDHDYYAGTAGEES